MAWYTSMIVIKNRDGIKDDNRILEALDLSHFGYSEEVNMNDVFHPKDNSVSIGYYDDYIIICDDFRFTDLFFTPDLSEVEEKLLETFPNSDIVSVSHMGNIHFKGYALLKKGEKIRYQTNEENDYGEANMMGKITDDEIAAFEDKDFEFIINIIKSTVGLDFDHENASILYDDYLFKKYIPVQSEFDGEEEEEYDDDFDEVEPNSKSDSARPWWQFWK